MNHRIPRIGQHRAMHLIDAENLCGSPLLTVEDVERLRREYFESVPIGPLDQIIIASAHVSVLSLIDGWPGQRYLMRSGRNGADVCLADVVIDEGLHKRFDRVFMGSGDGGLAPFAGYLEGKGVRVTAVSRVRSLSARMRLATSAVIYLDRPGIAISHAA